MSGLPGSRRLVLLAALGSSACASNPAPHGWLAPTARAQADPYGAWIVVEAAQPPTAGEHQRARREVAGEFLAVDHDSVFVLLPSGAVNSIALATVLRARLAYYNSQAGALEAWTFAGSLSTISNGAYAIFTLPLWIIAGSLTTGGQSRAPIVSLEGGEPTAWAHVRMYARFPQGLPPQLPATLPPKVRERDR
jgi:hypothetical protein